jgi:hypothetical protein
MIENVLKINPTKSSQSIISIATSAIISDFLFYDTGEFNHSSLYYIFSVLHKKPVMMDYIMSQ